MISIKDLTQNEMQQINGGGKAGSCIGQVLGGGTIGAVKGGIGLSAIPVFGTAGGIVVGANVGMIAGGLKCLADNI